MKQTILALTGALLALPVLAQSDGEAEGSAAAIDVFDREPVKCIATNRIDRTEIIDERTVVFHMYGRSSYVTELSIACPRLVQTKRFSYDIRTSRLCNTDFISVLEYWGTTLREGPSCGLGMFYPITKEEAERLDADPDEMLEAADAVKETVESTGEAVIPADDTDEN